VLHGPGFSDQSCARVNDFFGWWWCRHIHAAVKWDRRSATPNDRVAPLRPAIAAVRALFITVGRARKPRSSADQRASGSFPQRRVALSRICVELKYRILGPRIPTFRDWQARLILAYGALALGVVGVGGAAGMARLRDIGGEAATRRQGAREGRKTSA